MKPTVRTLSLTALLFASLALFVQCKHEPEKPVLPIPAPHEPDNPTPEPEPIPDPKPEKVDYIIDPFEELQLETTREGITYEWSYARYRREDKNELEYKLFSKEKAPYFWIDEGGLYKIQAKIKLADGETEEYFLVEVRSSDFRHSPYIAKVFDFTPAPGQFVNEFISWEEGMSREELLQKVWNRIGERKQHLLSLGAFGGAVVFGFDHMVPNLEGNDLAIWGNAFPNASEAGIVEVAYDANHNGIPDDPWYELYGSAHHATDATFHYEVTYYRPDPQKQPVLDPSNPDILDVQYIRWEDNQGNEGYIARNKYHLQSYYPAWIKEDSYTLKGTRLKNNAVLVENGKTKKWELRPFEWGYVDNKPNNLAEGSQFDLSHARDKEGKPIALRGIHFVRVYTALNQVAGALGETSTEVMHAYDIRFKNLQKKP